MDTHTQSSVKADARDKLGRFFSLATYGATVEAIHANKAALTIEAADLSLEGLDARLLQVKADLRGLGDVETVLVAEAKSRIENGAELEHFKLETYVKASGFDWKAVAADMGLSQEAFRSKYASIVTVESLKPK